MFEANRKSTEGLLPQFTSSLVNDYRQGSSVTYFPVNWALLLKATTCGLAVAPEEFLCFHSQIPFLYIEKLASAMQQVNEAAVLHGFIDLLIHRFTSVSHLCLHWIVISSHREYLTDGLRGNAGLSLYCSRIQHDHFIGKRSKYIIIGSNYGKNYSNLVLKFTWSYTMFLNWLRRRFWHLSNPRILRGEKNPVMFSPPLSLLMVSIVMAKLSSGD